MAEPEIKVRDLAGVRDWEEWIRNKVTIEFFDTLKARIVLIRDELETVQKDQVEYKQGEIANLRFLLELPVTIISDLTSKEKEDARRKTAGSGE